MSTATTSAWTRMRLIDAPLGTQFRYLGKPDHVYVLLDHAGSGICGDAKSPNPSGRQFQGMYSVAESRADFEAMEAEVRITTEGPVDTEIDVHAAATHLAHRARRAGFILRIDQESQQPPAMGRHVDVVTVYPKRGGE